MPTKGGVVLNGITTFLRAIELLGSILILGITSYWLGVLSNRNASIPTWMKAVEGIAGGAVIYSAFAVLLTCFVGGKTFFAFLAVLLDILFVGGFIAIAVLARGGIHKCSGSSPPSPLGPGNRTSCRLETAVFAVAIFLALCFLVSAALQVLLSRHHKKEKRYGPGPSNGYTSGTAKKQPFWKRKRGPKTTHETNEMGTVRNGGTTTTEKQPFWKRNKNNPRDAELGTAGAGAGAGALLAAEKHRHDDRKSYETGATGTTAASPVGAAYGGPNDKYNEPTVPHVNNHGHHTHTGSDVVAPNSGYRESAGMSGGSHQPNVPVIHVPEPYTEVHHGGYPHSAAPEEFPSAAMPQGNYQRS